MKIRAAPTSSGGRVITGDTPYGRFRVEWDADGQLVSEWIEMRSPETRENTPCRHRGGSVGSVECESCSGKVSVKVFGCELHGRATIRQRIDGAACCQTCPDHTTPTDVAAGES